MSYYKGPSGPTRFRSFSPGEIAMDMQYVGGTVPIAHCQFPILEGVYIGGIVVRVSVDALMKHRELARLLPDEFHVMLPHHVMSNNRGTTTIDCLVFDSSELREAVRRDILSKFFEDISVNAKFYEVAVQAIINRENRVASEPSAGDDIPYDNIGGKVTDPDIGQTTASGNVTMGVDVARGQDALVTTEIPVEPHVVEEINNDKFVMDSTKVKDVTKEVTQSRPKLPPQVSPFSDAGPDNVPDEVPDEVPQLDEHPMMDDGSDISDEPVITEETDGGSDVSLDFNPPIEDSPVASEEPDFPEINFNIDDGRQEGDPF